MTETTRYLDSIGGDVEQMARTFDLHVGRHPSLPLRVLNYRRGMLRAHTLPQDSSVSSSSSSCSSSSSSRKLVTADHPIVAECRGLVVEIDPEQNDKFVRVIAKGFQRFWHIVTDGDNRELSLLQQKDLTNSELAQLNTGFDFDNPFEVQSKEDGSFMLLYWFHDRWIVSSRHNFGEEMCSLAPIDGSTNQFLTKSALVLSTIGLATDATDQGRETKSDVSVVSSASAMLSSSDISSIAPNNLQRGWTYCIELCSKFNRIIRLYETPTVFLLGIVHPVSSAVGSDCSSTNSTSWVEIQETTWLQQHCDNMQKTYGVSFQRPWTQCGFTSLRQVYETLELRTQRDPTEEGVVLIDRLGRRLKVKTPMYKLLHKLRYLGWVTCTPSVCLPLLISDGGQRMQWVLEHLPLSEMSMSLIKQRIQTVQRALDCAWQHVRSMWRSVAPQCSTFEDFQRLLPPKWPFCSLLFRTAKNATETAAAVALSSSSFCPWTDDDRCIAILRANWESMMPVQVERACFENGRGRDDMYWSTFESQIHGESDSNRDRFKIISHIQEQLHSCKRGRYCLIRECSVVPAVEYNDGITSSPPVLRTKSDGSSHWDVTCFCGHAMKLVYLKQYFHVARPCHCGWDRNGSVKTYVPRTWLWMCTNEPNCILTMEAQQRSFVRNGRSYKQGEPLGIPASATCKSLRLCAHDLLSRVVSQLKDSHSSPQDSGSSSSHANVIPAVVARNAPPPRDDNLIAAQYAWLADSMEQPRDSVHMSSMTSSACRTVINLLQQRLYDSEDDDATKFDIYKGRNKQHA